MRPRPPLTVHRSELETLAPPVLLRLMRLASPSLPVGGFSYSEGLEVAVEHGLVRDEAETLAWLADQLRHALVPSELAAVEAVSGFTTSAQAKCDTAEQSVTTYIRKQIEAVTTADR